MSILWEAFVSVLTVTIPVVSSPALGDTDDIDH